MPRQMPTAHLDVREGLTGLGQGMRRLVQDDQLGNAVDRLVRDALDLDETTPGTQYRAAPGQVPTPRKLDHCLPPLLREPQKPSIQLQGGVEGGGVSR